MLTYVCVYMCVCLKMKTKTILNEKELEIRCWISTWSKYSHKVSDSRTKCHIYIQSRTLTEWLLHYLYRVSWRRKREQRSGNDWVDSGCSTNRTNHNTYFSYFSTLTRLHTYMSVWHPLTFNIKTKANLVLKFFKWLIRANFHNVSFHRVREKEKLTLGAGEKGK